MTLHESYLHYTQPLYAFGKTFPPIIEGELTIEKLKAHAQKNLASNLPLIREAGRILNNHLFNSGYNLNGII